MADALLTRIETGTILASARARAFVGAMRGWLPRPATPRLAAAPPLALPDDSLT